MMARPRDAVRDARNRARGLCITCGRAPVQRFVRCLRCRLAVHAAVLRFRARHTRTRPAPACPGAPNARPVGAQAVLADEPTTGRTKGLTRS